MSEILDGSMRIEGTEGSAARACEAMKDHAESSPSEQILSEPFWVPVDSLEYTERDTNPDAVKSLEASLRKCQFHDVIVGPQKSNGKYPVIAGNRRTTAAVLGGLTHLRVRIYSGPHSEALSVAENAQRRAESPRSLLSRLRTDFDKKGTGKETIKEIRQMLGAEIGIKKSTIHYLVAGALLDESDYQNVLASKNVIKAIRDLGKKNNKKGKRKVRVAKRKRQTLATSNALDVDSHATWLVADQIQLPLSQVAANPIEKETAGAWVVTVACPIGSPNVPINWSLVASAAMALARRVENTQLQAKAADPKTAENPGRAETVVIEPCLLL